MDLEATPPLQFNGVTWLSRDEIMVHIVPIMPLILDSKKIEKVIDYRLSPIELRIHSDRFHFVSKQMYDPR